MRIPFGPDGTVQIDDLATGGVQTQQFNAWTVDLIDGDKLRIKTTGLGNFSAIDAATPGTLNGSPTELYLTSGGQTVATLLLNGEYQGDGFGVSLPEGGFVTVGMGINAPTDFTGDGTGDVLFQNDQNGQLIFATMQNGAFASWGVATGGLGTLSAVGHGDVNGDGISDVVVQDPISGQMYVGEEDGSGSGNANWAYLGSAVPGFTAVGVGDIQGDDRADVVIQNGSGVIDYYDSRDNTFAPVSVASGWNVGGVGDVNGDGYADIVIQNPTSGQILYGNMKGGTFQGWDPVAIAQGWAVKAVADLTGNGYADIVIQNASTGSVLFANMLGGAFDGWFAATPGLTPDYVVKDTADVFGTGRADLIVQQQSTGYTYYFTEGGVGYTGLGLVTTGIDSQFHVV